MVASLHATVVVVIAALHVAAAKKSASTSKHHAAAKTEHKSASTSKHGSHAHHAAAKEEHREPAAWTPDRLWGAGDGTPAWSRVQSLHDIKHAFRLFPPGRMRENYDVVSASDHEWCTLTRYNWACVGDAYAAVLKRTQPYRPWRFQLANLPQSARIFADGNSYLAERMTTLLCGCHSTDVFKLDGNNMNSYLAHSAKNNATFLLFAAAASEAFVGNLSP